MVGRFILAALPASVLLCPTPAAAQNRLENDRWAETWTSDDEAYKNMALGPFRVDLGADLRWRVEAVDNPRFGLTTQDDDAWLQQRLQAHANISAGDDARLFVQLGAYDVIGRDNPGANDDDRLDLQQGFLDLTPSFAGFDARLRLGRQELGGDNDFNPRFLGAGDAANIRRRFEAARLTLRNQPWRVDLLAANPVVNEPGAFDDRDMDGEHIFGGFAERRASAVSLRGYAFDHARRDFALAGVTADDRRQTYGALFTAQHAAYALELDLTHQDGAHGAYDVDAWGAYLGLSRDFPHTPWAPRLTLRVTYGSGDSDANDGVIETYAPPVPRSGWFSDGGFTSASNIVEAAAVTTLRPNTTIRIDAKIAGLWRAENADYVYAAIHTALPNSRGDDAFIGLAPRLQVQFQATRHITLRGDVTAFFVSDRITALGGDDAVFAAAHIAWRY